MVDAMTILSAMALVGHMDALRYPAWHMVSSVVLIKFPIPRSGHCFCLEAMRSGFCPNGHGSSYILISCSRNSDNNPC